MAKKPFEWDSEDSLGSVAESEKVIHDIKFCTLNNQEYISVTKNVLKVDGSWGIAKNQVFKRGTFEQIAKQVNSFLYEGKE